MLPQLFAFTRMIAELREVKRLTKYTTSDVYENDVEHSYHLAMVCRYILEQHPEYGYDLDKVLKYALVHDIVEVYAGDTNPFWGQDNERIMTKHDRELTSLQRLEDEFPELDSIRRYVHDYEHKSDKEAVFVYAIDKLVPEMSIIPDEWRVYQELNLTMNQLLQHKDKALIDPLASELHAEITDIIKQHPEWFPR